MGVAAGVSLVIHDVTDRHHADEDLRFQKSLLEAQSEASIDGIPNLVVVRGPGSEHRGVPKDLIPETEQTWRDQYWSRIKAYLERATS